MRNFVKLCYFFLSCSFALQVKVLYVRNFLISTNPETIQSVFESAIGTKVERVKKMYDYAFIHFFEREHAELAMARLQNAEVDGSIVEIKWAKPVDRELYRIQKLNKGNAKFNHNMDLTQTLLLYKQHVDKREFENAKDEGIGSGCTADSTCGSPGDGTTGYRNSALQDNYTMAPAKLDAMCRM